jgi:hypothetical protein
VSMRVGAGRELSVEFVATNSKAQAGEHALA